MSETFQRPDKTFFQDPKEFGDLMNNGELCSQIFAKTDGHRQNTRSNTGKSIERHTFAHGS